MDQSLHSKYPIERNQSVGYRTSVTIGPATFVIAIAYERCLPDRLRLEVLTFIRRVIFMRNDLHLRGPGFEIRATGPLAIGAALIVVGLVSFLLTRSGFEYCNPLAQSVLRALCL